MTQDEVKRLFEYRDGALYWKVRRSGVNTGDQAGCLSSSDGYWRIRANSRLYQAHRLIFLWHHGYLPSEVDHVNNIRDDNRIENLRAATTSQNAQNTGLTSRNTSGVKGVNWDTQHGKWQARCCLNGVTYHLGLFKAINDAESVVIKFRENLHGKFANHGRVVR